MRHSSQIATSVTVGIDLGDRHSQVCVFDETGRIVEEARLATTPEAFDRRFRGSQRMRIAIEAGTHSPWVSRQLGELGHDVIVANPRKLRLIYENESKTDRVDAEYLGRIARVDPKLLAPIQPRGKEAQVDRGLLHSRDALVRTRTLLVNHVRGTVKSLGQRLPSCSTESFPAKVAASIPKELWPALSPVLDTIGALNQKIRKLEKLIEKTASKTYPETAVLMQVHGIGSITALAYVLTIEDPTRFKKSRSVGSYVGLRPRKSESGDSDPQLRITKAGDALLRRLLVQAGHYILGPFGPDSDLRRWGLAIAQRGGKNAKRRAVVAVARKLAVLLHRLWLTGEVYEPLRNAKRSTPTAA